MVKTRFLMIAAAVCLFGSSVQANLIVNGSFETLPRVLGSGSWTTYSSIEGWTADYGLIEVRNNVQGVAQDGNIFVEMDSDRNSSMYSQSVSTVVGSQYTLSYYYAPRINNSAASNGIELYFNDVLLDSYTSFSNTNNAWEQRVFTVTGTGSDKVSFKAVGTSDSYGGSIDNVSMERASSVPEPGLIMLLGTGLLSLIGFNRRLLRRK